MPELETCVLRAHREGVELPSGSRWQWYCPTGTLEERGDQAIYKAPSVGSSRTVRILAWVDSDPSHQAEVVLTIQKKP
jgi:hypothetical protein